MGIPLSRIPDIQALYGEQPFIESGSSVSDIAFDTADRMEPLCHVIAARITAENPDAGFQPTSGAITQLNFRSSPDVWGYFSTDSFGRVHSFADSQIGHIFARGSTREDARKHLVVALKELEIRGEIRTTVEYLIDMICSHDFRQNHINTAWLDGRIARGVTAAKPVPIMVAIAGAVWRSNAAYNNRRQQFIAYLGQGQHPKQDFLVVDDNVDLIYKDIKYSMHVTRSGPDSVTLACNGSWLAASFREMPDSSLLIQMCGTSHEVYGEEKGTGLSITLDGHVCMFTHEYDPTKVSFVSLLKLRLM
jgi:acetyl/propionyl-CoA carboxylase alpha subunit